MGATARIASIVLLALAGCGDDDGGDRDAGAAGGADAGLHACDALVGSERTITLGEVLAAGRDAQGVVYVLDRDADGALRVFVSDGDALQRHRVLGAGEGTLPGVTFYDVEVEADPPFTLYLELPDGAEPSFTRIDTPGRNAPDASATGELLEALDEEALAGLKLENLPPEVFIEYFGELEDGRRVLVTRPEDDWSYDDFRVFIGPPERMVEREVNSVLRQRDGGSTTIEITIEGDPATLSFPIVNVGGMFEPGPWTLEQDGALLPITRLEPAPAALDGLSFLCR